MGSSTGQLVAYVKKEKGFSNFTQEEAQNKCEALYESKGADAYNRCVPAYAGATSNSEIRKADKYVSALANGYTKSFDEFKQESLASLGSSIAAFGQGVLDTFQSGGSQGYTSGGYNSTSGNTGKTSNNTALFVVLGLVVVGGIGFAIYKSQD